MNSTGKNHLLTYIVHFFIFGVFCIVPIIFKNYYFDILDVKYYTYCGLGIILMIAAIILLPIQYRKEIKNISVAAIKHSLSVTDIALIAFWVSALISTCTSDFVYESFWGNEGRFTGLFLLSIYTATYFIVTRFGEFKEWQIKWFLRVGMFVCLFGITDYFKMDLMGFKENISPQQYNIFTSTIGNVNTYTAYVAMVVAVSTVMFVMSKSKWKRFSYYVCTVISLFAIVVGQSDNAYLALMALFGFLPLYLFKNKKGIMDYGILAVTMLSVIQAIAWINDLMGDKVVGFDGLFDIVADIKLLFPIICLLWSNIAIIAIWVRKNHASEMMYKKFKNSIIQKVWGCLIAAIFIIIVFMLVDSNAFGHSERYGVLGSYLKFSDSWGTNRGYIWRLSVEEYAKFPLLKKLFGYGPDTFGILTVLNRKEEMVQVTNQVFDSAHNEYLQYLVTIGFAGLASYLVFLISAITSILKNAKKNPCFMAIAFAIICYNVQALVNLNLPIATPVMWMFVMVGMMKSNKNLE